MMISGASLMIDIPSDPSFKDRFCYWHGASGKKYIHSVYGLEDCPPLPGAIYVAVRRQGDLRTVMGLGRFLPLWDGVLSGRSLDRLRASGVNEIHVHLMAKSVEQYESVLADLGAALCAEPFYGCAEHPAVLDDTRSLAA